ncbi:MAG: SUF system Fe-S cluster assembly protein [Bacteroidetes bacterium]|nr:SUF system Fe-S cluster assembly protein [Bacteroidota bacterium]
METPNTIPYNPFEQSVIDAMKRVFDPEIPINIYDLGLIYNLKIDDQHNVEILMTLTTPNCPIAEDMPGIVQEEVSRVEGVGKVKVELTFEPPWDMANLSEEAKVELGLI